MKKTKKNCWAFGFTANFTFATASVMMDIKKYCPDFVDEIVIFHNGINDKDKKLLNRILPTKFYEYNFPIKISKLSDSAQNYFTSMVFSKFEALKLLQEYERVIFSDYDILIQGDLSEMFKDCPSGWRVVWAKNKVRDMLYREIDDYDMDKESFHGAFHIVWDHLPDHQKMWEWCYFALEEYAEALWLPETGVFNLLWQEFNIDVERSLHPLVYDCHPSQTDHTKDAKIIHAYAQPKFWNGWDFPQWEQNYRKWAGWGGTPYYERTMKYKLQQKFFDARNKIQRSIGPMKKLIKNLVFGSSSR
ncbi:putative glycosyltransferase family 8 protein [Gloeomargarita lithophora Alchichica-D10]|uniref:Putative glycosyltransferase family 8 protein n=1 Tax=Gloeomargarita lithophora Alchichica-D10 TaxID=1188229 RepID=A0A1J0AE59_9CYAN|nr:glycosyltransferase [Gloeomargarita lithophora]APB34217.1 putative glycosyltransferase family 8 protein [Gloeomargarita lithophora Alchichica-D10]